MKQGGIIFHILINMYMDDLSIALNSSRIKDAYEMILNHLCYVVMLMIYVLLLSSCRIQSIRDKLALFHSYYTYIFNNQYFYPNYKHSTHGS